MSHPVFGRRRPPQRSWGALLIAVGLAGLWAAPPFGFAANGDPGALFEDGIVIPYEGSLMADGEEMSGVVTMRFSLSNGPSVQYVETHEQVALYRGRFSVRLGTGTDSTGDLRQIVLEGNRLDLGISIADETGAFVPLAGTQTIDPVAYSAATGHAARLTVAGNLTVDGNVRAPEGNIRAPNLTATGLVRGATVAATHGDIRATGEVFATRDIRVGGNLQSRGATADGSTIRADGAITAATVEANEVFGHSALVTGHATATRRLRANFPARFGPVRLMPGLGSGTNVSSEERLHFRSATQDGQFEVVGGDVDVIRGNIRTTGDVVANNNSLPGSNCSWTEWHQRTVHFSGSAPSTSEDASYNERECPDGRFVVSMDFTHVSGANRTHDERVRIYCCEL